MPLHPKNRHFLRTFYRLHYIVTIPRPPLPCPPSASTLAKARPPKPPTQTTPPLVPKPAPARGGEWSAGPMSGSELYGRAAVIARDMAAHHPCPPSSAPSALFQDRAARSAAAQIRIHRLAQHSTQRCHQNKANFNTDGRKNAATRGGQRAI